VGTEGEVIFPILALSASELKSVPSDFIYPEVNELELDIQLESENISLSIFRKDGFLYLSREGQEGNAELTEEKFPFLSLQYSDLLDDSIYHCNVSEIDSLYIEDSEEHKDYNISLTGESVNLEGLINGVSIAYPEIVDFIGELLNTGIARQIPEQPFSRSSGIFSIQIYKKNGSIDRLDFVPSKRGELILFVNETAHFTTYNKTVLDIRRTLSELIQKEGA
jgi:hypothetical protein